MSGNVLKLTDYVSLKNDKLICQLELNNKGDKYFDKTLVTKFSQIFEVEEELIEPYFLLFTFKKEQLQAANLNKDFLDKQATDGGKLIFNYSMLKSHMKEFSVKEINSAIQAISTHNFKIPDAKESGLIYNQAEYQIDGLLYGNSIKYAQKLDISGTAALFPNKFMIKQFIYKDKLISVFEELMKPDEEKINSTILQKFSKLFSIDIDAINIKLQPKLTTPTNQILWPIDSDNFIAITSVPNVGVLNYLQDNLAYNPKTFIPNKQIMVGGSKPQNAGVMIMGLNAKLRVIDNSWLPTKLLVNKKALNGLIYLIFDFAPIYVSLKKLAILRNEKSEPEFPQYIERQIEGLIFNTKEIICKKIILFKQFSKSNEISKFILESDNGKLLFNLSQQLKSNEYRGYLNILKEKLENELREWFNKVAKKDKHLEILRDMLSVSETINNSLWNYVGQELYE